ncbi:MAG: 5-(carboxyamino)imidazole ribonucleotide mutase [Deltaproteobacteria bacterium CG11_big_fil_rev_8_21_14_0_20_49_13]|nr:MAG: 5-(carboxyamino)imidazole ribonucleotide mutase [Deltaproteobacteria bacterium CG11_big_fil_rev_8_21_14_0_20_49_13]
MTTNAKVAILMGSDSDLPVMEETGKILKEFGVEYDIRISSAHRTPEDTAEFSKNAAKNGIKVIIAGAGLAAHLPGVIASHTTLPVIGVPLVSAPFEGLDAILSILQMPPGVPVATVAVGKVGAKNAALLAVEMLALSDEGLQKKLADHRKKMAADVAEKNKKLCHRP